MKTWIMAAICAFSAAAASPVLADPGDTDEPSFQEREHDGKGRKGRGGELRKAMKERREFRAKLREARRRYLEAKTADERKSLRSELEKAIGEEMDLRLKRMETRLAKLRERLPVLEKRLAAGKKNRDKLVKLRLDLLETANGKNE